MVNLWIDLTVVAKLKIVCAIAEGRMPEIGQRK
jgi:hypothetical protein